VTGGSTEDAGADTAEEGTWTIGDGSGWEAAAWSRTMQETRRRTTKSAIPYQGVRHRTSVITTRTRPAVGDRGARRNTNTHEHD